ncbi:2-succinyl-5-enolpyruvyl-6-hydroxy-3-cyclohexene-1-carboxylic-acid synthase [Rhodohalobacter barkolensis]|uniref:2-succinyl-5-enolpyruvyl-6-hydroxy-3-cyclohexene-1-carboxylate synthase n=1 Tax=Rhodohalobacter barkolensis TaxID=2053187 RepID=A0A2N0VL59_9BACT|nr:2-succinyl-5-enolpyruvyl-6-hydroxy-3-cyclohexene-1-carboxylic-acid synthase [Rhodohalobacter barkolensis]PKD44937.1 2-succinyl-5-enolpyruvyl-6-hydroxy-3-cyclohexene-1-carboxylic-acid synthase [Rhodohalobacter barkolensis]
MNSHLRWTSEFLNALYQHGVQHAIISPGSRSTPLTIAAAIHPGIKKQIVLDERSAGFIALGIGKATGIPAVLICTSGTAAANYLPAITEAKESGVSMIVLTADRPPNLRGIGSSQTVDQIKLYGDQAVFFHEAGEPCFDQADLKRLRYAAKQAAESSIDLGGAAHLNFPFRKPLEPTSGEIQFEKKQLSESYSNEKLQSSIQVSQRTIRLDKDIIKLITDSKRPLIVAGPANSNHRLINQIKDFSEWLNSPVIAEPGSGFSNSEYQVHRYEQFLRSEEKRESLQPDLILRFGDQPFTKSMLVALDAWSEVPTIYFSSRKSTQDHSMSVNHKVECQSSDQFDYADLQFESDPDWISKWKKADQFADIQLKKSIEKTEALTDGHVFHFLSNRLEKNWKIMLSNSFIPRDMAMFGESRIGQFVNRGAAGIDGILSTAIGIAKSTESPVCCVTGDLAFLHDSNALLSLQKIQHPFIIAVINNGGGNIFKMLPVSENKEFFRDYFITPQNVKIQELAEAHSIPFRRVQSKDELKSLDLMDIDGVQLIEFVTDPDESMKQRRTLWEM